MGTVLYGSEIAKDIRASLKEQINELREKKREKDSEACRDSGRKQSGQPSLCDRKEKACREIGMENILLQLKGRNDGGGALAEIQRLNTKMPVVEGILVSCLCQSIWMSIKFCLLLIPKRMSMAFIHII